MGRLEVGWEKVACWSTKAAISPKRVTIKIDEKLLWMAYRNSPTLFEQYNPRPLTASSPSTLGVCNPNPKLQSLLSQEWVKLQTSNLADTFTGSIGRKAHEKFWRKGSIGISRDFSNFWSTPYYLRNR